MPRETEDFEFEAGGGDFGSGPSIPGWYAATLVTIGRPVPSKMKNDQGEYPLTSTFDWLFDPFAEVDDEGAETAIDNFSKWSYISVNARGDGSNFNKAHTAMFGVPVPRGPFASKGLLGGRALVNWGPSKNDPEKFAILGYAAIPKPRPAARRTAPPPPPQQETFGDAPGDDEPFD